MASYLEVMEFVGNAVDATGVAGDIIRTVAVSPTRENVVILALIVLIRTFLSMALQLEIDGRWPWQTPSLPPTPAPTSTHVPAPPPRA